MNIQTENDQQDGGNYYLPCGSPFQNMRPMTPIDSMLWSILNELSDYKLGDVQDMIQIMRYDREKLRQQQQEIYDANRADCHDKVGFQSIVKEVNININKDVEKEEDDDEVSNANSGSESESEPDNSESKTESKIESKIESKPKYEPKSEPNKSNQSSTKEDTTKFIFGILIILKFD